MDIEIGQVWRHVHRTEEAVTVKAIGEPDGASDRPIWVMADSNRGYRTLWESTLKTTHEIRRPFFEVGKSYRFSYLGKLSFNVLSLHEFAGEKWAQAEVYTKDNDPSHMTHLSAEQFERMVEDHG